MKRVLVFLMVMALTATTALFIACSDDDDNGTGNEQKLTGDLNDPLFLAADDALEGSGEQIGTGIQMMMTFIGDILDSAAQLGAGTTAGVLKPTQPDTVWWNDAANHWVAKSEGDYITWYEYGIDSVQLMHGAQAVQWPDSALLTRINGGGYHVELAYIGPSTDTSYVATYLADISGNAGEIVGLGDVVANASGRLYYRPLYTKDAQQTYCDYEIDATYQANNVAMNLADAFFGSGCPTGGTISQTAHLTIDCTGDTTFSNTDTWFMQTTFTADSLHYVVENSTHRWTYSEACSDK